MLANDEERKSHLRNFSLLLPLHQETTTKSFSPIKVLLMLVANVFFSLCADAWRKYKTKFGNWPMATSKVLFYEQFQLKMHYNNNSRKVSSLWEGKFSNFLSLSDWTTYNNVVSETWMKKKWKIEYADYDNEVGNWGA